MKVTEIEYTCSVKDGDKIQSLGYRVTLEPWESPEETLDLLRDIVTKELSLEDCYAELRSACECKINLLEGLRERTREEKIRLAQAESAWEEFSEFLASHGVDPHSLTIEEFRKSRPANQPEDTGSDDEELEVRQELHW